MNGGKMRCIENEARINNPVVNSIRGLLEHRALWLYFIMDEADKKGIPYEDTMRDAIKRCGFYQGGILLKKGKTDSLNGLKRALFGIAARIVFEMKIIKSDENNLEIDFYYCPLVKAWQKQNCTGEQIEKLCDIAMCGDRGIAETYGAMFELPKTIARGDKKCELRFRKKNSRVI